MYALLQVSFEILFFSTKLPPIFTSSPSVQQVSFEISLRLLKVVLRSCMTLDSFDSYDTRLSGNERMYFYNAKMFFNFTFLQCKSVFDLNFFVTYILFIDPRNRFIFLVGFRVGNPILFLS